MTKNDGYLMGLQNHCMKSGIKWGFMAVYHMV